MTRDDLLDIRAALDKASNWARSQKDLFQMIDAKKKVEAMLNELSLPSNLDEAAEKYQLEVKKHILDGSPIGTAKDAFIAGAEWQRKQDEKETAALLAIAHLQGMAQQAREMMGKGDSLEKPTCKSCGFYENDCPFTRGKFMPYPNRVCKDFTFSVIRKEE